MDTALITPLISGGGFAGVIVILFVIGWIVPKRVADDKDRQIAEWKQAYQAERERADTAVAASQATRDVLAAIQVGRQLPHTEASP